MNWAEFHFIRPYCLWAFIPALIIFMALLKNKLSAGNWHSICDPDLLPFIIQDRDVRHSHWPLVTGSIAAMLVIIALAGPTWEKLPAPVFKNDAALVIALDLSRSMDAADVVPSRLIRARYKINDILKQRKDGQTALIVYTDEAFVVAPLTQDNETIINQLAALSTAIMPSSGSNARLAIERAVALLQQAGLQQGDILLVSDAVDFAATVATVQSLGNYRLSLLGVGTKAGAPITERRGGFVKDHAGTIVVPKLDSDTLALLSEKGNGKYATISNDDSDIEMLMNYFDTAIETPTEEGYQANNLLLNQWRESGYWLLLLVLPLAALSFRKGLLSWALLAFLFTPETSYALDWKDLWQTQNQQGQRAFKQEKFGPAAEYYNDPQWKAAAQYQAGQFGAAADTLQEARSASDLYNQGNALAQAGQFKKALKAYQQSLQIEPNNDDAKYNQKLVEKALEQQQQQPAQAGESGEQGEDGEPTEGEQSAGSKAGDEQAGDGKAGDGQSGDEQAADGKAGDEQTPDDKASDEQAADGNSADPNATDSTDPEADGEGEQTEQQRATADADKKPTAEEAAADSGEDPNSKAAYDETEQANEQWLKRIPDNPAVLLKNKFKHQYKKRKRQTTQQQQW